MYSGTASIRLSASSAAASCELSATAVKTSMPTTSRVRNVALTGLPIAGPVIASTSSNPSPNSLAAWTMTMSA